MKPRHLTARGCIILLSTLLFPPALSAQEGNLPPGLLSGFQAVADFVERSAEAVPEDQYEFSPTDGVRTFRQLVAHVVDSHLWYCTAASGEQIPWAPTVENAAPSKAELIEQLRKAEAGCLALMETPVARVDLLVESLGHSNLHYGNIIVYMRMLGLTPPSSQRSG